MLTQTFSKNQSTVKSTRLSHVELKMHKIIFKKSQNCKLIKSHIRQSSKSTINQQIIPESLKNCSHFFEN